MVIVVSEPSDNVDVTVSGASVAEGLPSSALALVLAPAAASLVVGGNATELDTGVVTDSDTDVGTSADSVPVGVGTDSDADTGDEGADSVPEDVDTDSDADAGGEGRTIGNHVLRLRFGWKSDA